jgi:hypothetical protein
LPLSSCHPPFFLWEVEDIAEKWQPGWTRRRREAPDVAAAILDAALYPDCNNKEYDDLQNAGHDVWEYKGTRTRWEHGHRNPYGISAVSVKG